MGSKPAGKNPGRGGSQTRPSSYKHRKRTSEEPASANSKKGGVKNQKTTVPTSGVTQERRGDWTEEIHYLIGEKNAKGEEIRGKVDPSKIRKPWRLQEGE